MGEDAWYWGGWEPGCYVDGVRGRYAISFLVLSVLPEFATHRERRLMRAYDRGWLVADLSWVADEIATDVGDRFNEVVGSYGLTSFWEDGSWFVADQDDVLVW